ncbi:hypothetical protein QPZ67_10695 [Bacillus stercoris]|nr:hypothetical protein [Bacillus stercoris]WIL37036.1 hypothetical protein QPZ67_10695 [Bacillus stercoris]
MRLAHIDKHERSILREFQLQRSKTSPSQVAFMEQAANDVKTYRVTSKPIQKKKEGRAELNQKPPVKQH